LPSYRLQRERVRDQSIEMLQTLIDNPNAAAAAKEEAEKLLLEIVRQREQELLVEEYGIKPGLRRMLVFSTTMRWLRHGEAERS